jgi:hypothetical protein
MGSTHLTITPEPDEAQRRAILAALAAEGAERTAAPGWAGALLSEHDENEP